MARRMIRTTLSQPGAEASGLPRSTVSIALAWISGPGIWPSVDVGWRSWSEGR